MTFKKGNTFGARRFHERPIDKNHMIGFRGYEGQWEKLKAVPNWKERLREFVDELIAENSRFEQDD